MISKIKIIVVFIVIIAVWIFSILMHGYEKKDSFKIENVIRNNIDVIKIYDVGFSDDSIIYSTRDSINNLCQLLSISKPVNFSDINFHSATNSYHIVLFLKNKEKVRVSFVQMRFITDSIPNGILQSGDYYYKNDSLLYLVIKKLNKKHKTT